MNNKTHKSGARFTYDTDQHRMVVKTCKKLGLNSNKDSHDYKRVSFVINNYCLSVRQEFNNNHFERIIVPEFVTFSFSSNRFWYLLYRLIVKTKNIRNLLTNKEKNSDTDYDSLVYTFERYRNQIQRMWEKRNIMQKQKFILKKNKL